MATGTADRVAVMNYSARAKWATVRVETDGAVYVGRVYIPETKKRLSDVLCDDRPFISLTEVSIDETETVEPFVAVNKQFIKTVRVLHEGEGPTWFRSASGPEESIAPSGPRSLS